MDMTSTAAVLIASLMSTGSAQAGDYPFSGDLAIAGDPEKAEIAKRMGLEK